MTTMEQIKPHASTQPHATGLCVLEAAVVAGKSYRLGVAATDGVEDANARAMVAQVRFVDAAGQDIVGSYQGCFVSERFGQYVYLASGTDHVNATWSEQIVTAPADAVGIKVVVHSWRASRALAIHGQPQIIEDSEELFEHEAQVKGGIQYRLYLSLTDVRHSDRSAVVQVRYLDSSGNELPGPYGGCYTSDRYGQFFYVGTPKGVSGEVGTALPTPERAVRVTLSARRWKGTAALKLVGKPRLESSLPDDVRQAEQWQAIGAEGREIKVHVPPSARGQHVLLQGQYLARQRGEGAVALRASLAFRDGEGRSILLGDGPMEGAVSERAFRLGSSEEPRVFECFAWCPPDASSVAIRMFPEDGTLNALVHREANLLALGQLEAAGRMETRLSVGEHVEHQVQVFPEWRLRIAFEGLRALDPIGSSLEIGIFFGDAQRRTLTLAGTDTRVSAGSLHRAGNILYLKPACGPSESVKIGHLRAALQVLPPPGAHWVMVRLQNSTGSEVPYTCSVEPCDALVEDRLEPRSAAGATRIELWSPDASRLMIEHLLERYPDDPAVLAGAIDVYRRLGAARQLEAIASRAMATPAAGGKLKFKARHVLASLQEQDPNWRIEVPGAWGPPAQVRDGGRPLRVAHMFKTSVPYENTGGAIRCLNIVKFQKMAGLDPLVVTPLGYPRQNMSGEPWELEDAAGIPHYRLNGIARDDLRTIPSTTQLEYTALLAANLLRRQDIDLVQASSGYRGYEQALVGLAVARKLSVPFVYEVRSYHEHTWRPMADWVLDAEFTRRRMAQEDRCMHEADAVVTICETMKRGLIGRGIDEGKIFVVPNSVDLDQFKMISVDHDLRERLGLRGKTVVGYISNLSQREGHHVLLRAVARVCAKGEDVCCLIVGGGPQFDSLRELAARLGIADRVVMTGEVPHNEVPGYYALIDVFVVPRVTDFASDFVTPMKPFEAMAMGCSVIISDLPALREIVEPGIRGLSFEQGDFEELAVQIIRLSRNVEERKRFADAGASWVRASRTWENTVHGYEAAYEFAASCSAKSGGQR